MTSMQPGSQGEWTGMHTCEQWQLHCTSQLGGSWAPLSEHVYCVAVAFKMPEQVEQWICIKFCIKLDHSSNGNYSHDSEGHSYGQLVIGSFIRTTHPLIQHVSGITFWWNIKSPRWLSPYGPDLVPCNFWLFLKLKSPLKGKRFQTIHGIEENMMEQLMVIGRTV